MKKSKMVLLICAALAAALILNACAKPPTEEMAAAAAAVTRAENDADAVKYAASGLARAREALNRMQAEADSKKYDAAKNYAADAISAADKAIADGKTGAARVRDEAVGLVNGVKTTLAETEKSINAAQGVKNIKLDFKAIDRDFDDAKRTTDQAEQSLAGADYQDALDKGRAARTILSDISAKVAGAATAASRKK
ncbi:hypothetical protein AGMMS49587_00130 [Spirochaetia bacterium]|nr:hypothetical protein AGMMS49587_00130 [Spirochaetia bacterium]